MIYKTDYELEVTNVLPSYIIKELRESYPGAALAIDDEGKTLHSSTWYNHKEQLIEFSERYPETLFILKGIGESVMDMSKKL